MIRTIALLLCFTASQAVPAAQAASDDVYVDGADYLVMELKDRQAFVLGAADMMGRMCEEVDAPEAISFCGRVKRCISDMSALKLVVLIDKYMTKPEYRDYSMVSNYRAAMNANCPA